MSTTIINGAPRFIPLGTDDQSIRAQLPVSDVRPTHLPSFYIMGQKGPTTGIYAASDLVKLYGASTFDQNKPYFNHQTRFLALAAGLGNLCKVTRIVPSDAGMKANSVVYIDIIATDIPNYDRNADGSIVKDSGGNPVVNTTTPTISGYKIKFIRQDKVADSDLGQLTSVSGTMSINGVRSRMYPIFESVAMYQGAAYDNIGYTLASMSAAEIDMGVIDSTLGLTYKLGLLTRPNANSSPVPFMSLYGEPSVMVSLKDKAVNPNTNARFDIGTVFKNQWYNTTNPLVNLVYPDMSLYFYRDNFETVLNMIMSKEMDYISAIPETWADNISAATIQWFDFTSADATDLVRQYGLINPFTCKSTSGVNYFTVQISTDVPTLTDGQREINMSTNTPVFMSGGSDGTLSNENFEAGVVADLANYLDANSRYMDLAINLDSYIWDSGFTIETKQELINYITLRKDTNIVLSTHDAKLYDKTLTLSDARAVAVTLKTRALLAPESDYYGTGVARAVIIPGAGKLIDGSTDDYIPLTYDLLFKYCNFMGAGDGNWKKANLFDIAPGNIITRLYNVSPDFIPDGIKPLLWSTGITWAQPFDRRQYQFPAIKTVYDNTTSVLNSGFVVAAVGECTKVAAEIYRNFTGSINLTDAQFIDKVNNAASEKLKSDKFAGLFVIRPNCIITAVDAARGYSWQLRIEIYANNMKSVMTYTTQVFRMSDLPQ